MPSALFLRDLDGLRQERLRLLSALGGGPLRDFIQPDEEAHQRLGAALARVAVLKTLDIAGMLRARAASLIGTARFPGC